MRSPAPLLICASLFASAPIVHAQSDNASATNLDRANAAFHAGYAAASQGDLATARQQFQYAVQLAPQVEEGHSALGAVLYRLGDYSNAIPELETAVHLKPEDQAAQENLAMAYAQTGAYQKALPIFEHLESDQGLQPLSANLLTSYARALAATQQLPAAIRETQAAINAAPQSALLYDQLGSLYAQMQNWPKRKMPSNKRFTSTPNSHRHICI